MPGFLPSFLRRGVKLDQRPLSIMDAPACAALHAAGFAVGWAASDFENLIIESNVVADAVSDGETGGLLGFVLSRLAADEAEILTIVVTASSRRRGLGRMLLASHTEALLRRGVRQLFLEVAADNIAALGLYKGLGFAQVGRRQAYYRSGSGQIDALVMAKPLS